MKTIWDKITLWTLCFICGFSAMTTPFIIIPTIIIIVIIMLNDTNYEQDNSKKEKEN